MKRHGSRFRHFCKKKHRTYRGLARCMWRTNSAYGEGRWALRVCSDLTGRPKILLFETEADMVDGKEARQEGCISTPAGFSDSHLGQTCHGFHATYEICELAEVETA